MLSVNFRAREFQVASGQSVPSLRGTFTCMSEIYVDLIFLDKNRRGLSVPPMCPKSSESEVGVNDTLRFRNMLVCWLLVHKMVRGKMDGRLLVTSRGKHI